MLIAKQSDPITALSAHNITKTVPTKDGDLTILNSLSLCIYPQQTVAIQGESGAGKTTLISILAGLDEPSSGYITWGEHNLGALSSGAITKLRGRLISFIFQSFYLLANLTAKENIEIPLLLKGYSSNEASFEAERQLHLVGLQHRCQHMPQQLSGGEQQRVAIARAFASKPHILFADEPTGNLDQKTSANIIKLLFDLNESHNTTLVIVTHDLQLAKCCQRQIWLDNAKLIE